MTYVMRWSGEQAEVYGDPLTLASLRILQDLPANNVALRRVRASWLLSFAHCAHDTSGHHGRFPIPHELKSSPSTVSPNGQALQRTSCVGHRPDKSRDDAVGSSLHI